MFSPFQAILSTFRFFNNKKLDEDTGEPVGGSDGLAIPCEYGEAGELVGRIIVLLFPFENFRRTCLGGGNNFEKMSDQYSHHFRQF